jgi:hypothetical protein
MDSLGGHAIIIRICDLQFIKSSVMLLDIMVFTETGSFALLKAEIPPATVRDSLVLVICVRRRLLLCF